MKTIITTTLSVLMLIFCMSCSDNSSGPEEPETMVTNVEGKVQAPDNSTPLEGATIYVGEALSDDASKAKSVMALNKNSAATDHCEEPSVDYSAYTCTEADGSFEFEVEVDISETEIDLKVFKGSFYFEETVEIGSDETSDTGEMTVPEDAVQMAVVTGSYDRMQDILAKVGFGEVITDESSFDYGQLDLGTEEFDLYDGDSSLDSDYPEMEALFEDNDDDGEPDIHNYDIVFINCGAAEEHINTKSTSAHSHEEFVAKHSANLSVADISTIQNFVENGGTLYATDWAYDYTEQVFPSYIDFLGSDSTPDNEAEAGDNAEQGEGGITVDAEILDSDMVSWFSNDAECDSESCLNEDQTIHIEDFLGSWAVIDDIHNGANANTWTEGPVEWGISGSGVQPLTVSYSPGDGQVIYSSYHTIESEFSPEFRPQERLLQYLVFE